MMKKFVSLTLVFALSAALLAGCGSASETTPTTTAPAATEETTLPAASYDSALALSQAIWETYGDDERFPAAGGDAEHDNMEGPGLFDMEKNAETFQYLTLMDEELMAMLENDAATMLHMMNTNTFCSAVAALKDSASAAEFAEHYKTLVQGNQWMCGFPDTVIVISVGRYVITAYGKDDPIQTFKSKVLALEPQATVLVEAPTEA